MQDPGDDGILYDEAASSFDESDDLEEVTKKPHLRGKRSPKKANMTKAHSTSTVPPPPPPPTLRTTTKKKSIFLPMNMENPPVQPLDPFFLEIRENDASFNRIQKLRELITDSSNELEVPRSISHRMTLEKVVSAVKLCRTMTYIDLSKTAAIISLQAQNNRMLLTER